MSRCLEKIRNQSPLHDRLVHVKDPMAVYNVALSEFHRNSTVVNTKRSELIVWKNGSI